MTQRKPMWARRPSPRGIAEYYRRYAETLLSVDESVGRIVGLLRDRKLLESTIVIFMGDNGFAFGEHGLIDKRTAYEESMRVPLLMAGGGTEPAFPLARPDGPCDHAAHAPIPSSRRVGDLVLLHVDRSAGGVRRTGAHLR